MRPFHEYDIEIFRLGDKTYSFEYVINDSFFNKFEGSYLSKGSLNASAKLTKSERLIRLGISIKGTVELICDRTLEPFDHIVEVSEEILFNFGEEHKEVSENVYVIPYDTQRLNIAQYIYEFIGLTVPMKKLHPRYQNETSESNGEILIYSTHPSSDDEEVTDPRWNVLKNLNNNQKENKNGKSKK
ncbi:MAG: DUF177 domain-containing protein [Cytophagaceae bacterium]|nr:DUF177 domain-containing protein [Cytophagaceae bacterium]MDW8457281.1 DUF177 domain-containing protein [Cytophagaceae bacterium]